MCRVVGYFIRVEFGTDQDGLDCVERILKWVDCGVRDTLSNKARLRRARLPARRA